MAGAAGALGSVDANTGDELIGWDTDQFPTSIYLTTQIMLTIPQNYVAADVSRRKLNKSE